MFWLLISHFSGCLSFRCFHWVMQGFPELFSDGFSCYLSPIRVSTPAHFRGNLINKQWCAEMWRSWVKCNLNRWLSCRAKLKWWEPDWSLVKLVASLLPEENSQNVYELDLSVVNRVMAIGEGFDEFSIDQEKPKLLQYHHSELSRTATIRTW